MAKSNIVWPATGAEELVKMQAVITKGDSLPFNQGMALAVSQFGAAKSYQAWIAIPAVQAVYRAYNANYSAAYAALTVGAVSSKDAEIASLRAQLAKAKGK